VDYPGRDGRIRAPKPIPNTPYWYISEVIPLGQEETQAMLLDTRDGSLHSLGEFFPEGTHWIEDVSPDGRWVYTWNFKSDKKIDNVAIGDIYLAPVTDFEAGSIVFSGVFYLTEVSGWETDPPAMLISPYPGSEEIIRISLDDLKSEVISAPAPFEAWQNGIRFVVNERPAAAPETFQVTAYSHENEMLGVLDLPSNTKGATIYPIGESETLIITRELIEQVGDICYYDYHLWQWNLKR
jgi:hypothetical protein